MIRQKQHFFIFLFMVISVGCTTIAHPTLPIADDTRIVHLLNRISFGPSPGDIGKVRNLGIEAYIEEQLNPASIPKAEGLEDRLSALKTLNVSIRQLSTDFEPSAAQLKNMSAKERKQVNKNKNQIVFELAQAKVLRALLNPAQLQEVMVDFWFNHFNVFAEKGADKIWISSYERDAIRPYVLGKFRDLLHATAQHPAMLFYLDNWLNTAPDSPGARGKNVGINENYARELLELHTLGVDGGYTQQDVTTLAHILTGWGLANGKELWQRAAFFFNPRRHDFADKTLLGTKVQGQGEFEIESILDGLSTHPVTAKHIAYQLAQAFVADDPPKSLVDQLTSTFLSTDGDISVVLRTLFLSNEFWDKQYTRNKFKPPFRYVISALRAGKAIPKGDTQAIQGALRNMGEPLYRCLTPNGYANKKDQWLSPDALLKRIDFARALNRFSSNEGASKNILSSFGGDWSKNTLDTVQDTDTKLKPVLLLNSPEFLYY